MYFRFFACYNLLLSTAMSGFVLMKYNPRVTMSNSRGSYIFDIEYMDKSN